MVIAAATRVTLIKRQKLRDRQQKNKKYRQRQCPTKVYWKIWILFRTSTRTRRLPRMSSYYQNHVIHAAVGFSIVIHCKGQILLQNCIWKVDGAEPIWKSDIPIVFKNTPFCIKTSFVGRMLWQKFTNKLWVWNGDVKWISLFFLWETNSSCWLPLDLDQMKCIVTFIDKLNWAWILNWN